MGLRERFRKYMDRDKSKFDSSITEKSESEKVDEEFDKIKKNMNDELERYKKFEREEDLNKKQIEKKKLGAIRNLAKNEVRQSLPGQDRITMTMKPIADKNYKFWEEGRPMIEFVFLLVLIVHAIDVFAFRFEINLGIVFSRVLMYVFIGFFAHLALKQDVVTSLKEFTGASLIPLFIFPGINAVVKNMSLSADILNLIGGIMAAFPAWIIYLRYYKGINYPFSQGNLFESIIKAIPSPVQWSKAWTTFWVLIAIVNMFFFIGGTIAGVPFVQGVGINPSAAVERMSEEVANTWDKVVIAAQGIFTGVENAITRYKNETLGTYYSGRVEENRRVTGVFIQPLKASGRFYEDIPIQLSALVKVRSFVEDVKIDFSCFAYDVKNKTHIVKGKVDPYQQLVLLQEDQHYVSCSFNDGPTIDGYDTSLYNGSYRIVLNASFNFQTWAYTQYVFLDRDILSYTLAKGEDLNRKFQIPKKPVTIYTAGPAKMGMNEDLEMPIPINTNMEVNMGETKVPIGITLDNAVAGTTGGIRRVNRYELRIPEQFSLSGSDGRNLCTREWANIGLDPNTPGYTIYTFTNPQQLDRTYLTVTCNMRLDDAGRRGLLENTLGLRQVSIIGMADYIYDMSTTTTIKVEPRTI